MSTLLATMSLLFFLAIVLVVGMALLSPFEALGWWRRSALRIVSDQELSSIETPPSTLAGEIPFFVVYLTAIGGISAEDISSRERRFLGRLQDALPTAVLVADIFPFSVSNNPLNGERPLGWLWQRLHNSRLGNRPAIFSNLIFIRNLFQVGVSSDPRYGPINNLGVANEVMKSLQRHGYPRQDGPPIILVAWSGGAQVAVGIAYFLKSLISAPIYVVSVGGVISNDPGLDAIDHLIHLQGSKDRFPLIGDILFPGRWSFVRHSHWNRALRDGRILLINPGPMRHTGRQDYFDRHALLPTGQSHLDKTVETMVSAITSTLPG